MGFSFGANERFIAPRERIGKDRERQVLTIHVDLDRGGHGHGEVVVGRLARQDRVEVRPGQLEEAQVVRDPVGADLLGDVVQEGVVTPPSDLWSRVT